jgi:hypothetical protein
MAKRKKQTKNTWEERQEKKKKLLEERGARVIVIQTPAGQVLYDIFRQLDIIYSNFKQTLGEPGGISYEDGEKEIKELQSIIKGLDNYTKKLSKQVNYKYHRPKSFFLEKE